jgi:hypothetical protein
MANATTIREKGTGAVLAQAEGEPGVVRYEGTW